MKERYSKNEKNCYESGCKIEFIADNSGQSALDTAIVCLIAIVLGALILAGLYALIDSEVMPTLSQRIKDMFDYTN